MTTLQRLQVVRDEIAQWEEGSPADEYERGYDHGIWQAITVIDKHILEVKGQTK